MARDRSVDLDLTRAGERLAREILIAYPQGLFPMAESRDDDGYSWYLPHARGVLPLQQFHISRSLSRFAKKHASKLTFAYSLRFLDVVDACAERDETWINPVIREGFWNLHQEGLAHSAEVYYEEALVGGVYGLALGGAFFGESMMSKATNGSKLALGFMVNDLHLRGFELYDTQFLTEHLATLGGIEITPEDYQNRLDSALKVNPKPIPKGKLDNAIRYFQASPGQEDHQVALEERQD